MPLNVALGRTQPQQCDILATFNESLTYFIHSAQYMGKQCCACCLKRIVLHKSEKLQESKP